ncbi:MAG: bifunctional phosphopantothenoylcysteine decarboxylase/phosphopantothenate--cysteine ligase CoaBC, partial [Gammaproteobacteria bacterium]
QVVMTRGACEFVTPLTFQALSGRPVYTQLLDHDSEAGMGHISLARWSDLIVVAPATANFIASVAHGMADDLLTTLCLAADVPLLLAPAMNQQMWQNPATRENIHTVTSRGVAILGPAEGDQACGETGPGRMLEPLDILPFIERQFHTGKLSGTRVLVTAGPTREPIDPVRYISNHSSGRMGFAVAVAAREAGADVTLVSGPVSLAAPERVRLIAVDTAEEMQDGVLSNLKQTDIFISAAAVADYRPAHVARQKLKKSSARLGLQLEKNPDILTSVAAAGQGLFTVGFAAETESVYENALAKLRNKGLDMIAANQVGNGLGFNTEDNALEVLWNGGSVSLEKSSKEKLARKLINIIADKYHEKNTNKAH